MLDPREKEKENEREGEGDRTGVAVALAEEMREEEEGGRWLAKAFVPTWVEDKIREEDEAKMSKEEEQY